MWNGTPCCRTPSAAVSAAVKGPTLVKPPSLVACMWAKSITGRTQSKWPQMATMSARLPSSWTRPMTSTPKSTARPLAARRWQFRQLGHDRGQRILARPSEQEAGMDDDRGCPTRRSQTRGVVEHTDRHLMLSPALLHVTEEGGQRGVDGQRHAHVLGQ